VHLLRDLARDHLPDVSAESGRGDRAIFPQAASCVLKID
jgi:hypothetical protein